jgi:hypothetical protein
VKRSLSVRVGDSGSLHWDLLLKLLGGVLEVLSGGESRLKLKSGGSVARVNLEELMNSINKGSVIFILLGEELKVVLQVITSESLQLIDILDGGVITGLKDGETKTEGIILSTIISDVSLSCVDASEDLR